MATLAIIGITTFIILLFSMSITAGTQHSISSLAKEWRWLLLVALWSQVLLLPPMMELTPELWKWLPFVGVIGIVGCGGASIFNKEDELVHMICAAIAFVGFTGWVMLMNSLCLLPIVVCMAAGREHFKWRIEVGLIISVYQTLLLQMINI